MNESKKNFLEFIFQFLDKAQKFLKRKMFIIKEREREKN